MAVALCQKVTPTNLILHINSEEEKGSFVAATMKDDIAKNKSFLLCVAPKLIQFL